MTVATAILAIRNEEACLANCLRHLVRNGLSVAIIDNGSTDASARIYQRREFASHLIGVWDLPFDGAFSLRRQLQLKLRIAETIGSDWIVHVDADEMIHSYWSEETLVDALSRVGAGGWNAVNFDEFVFLPIERDYTAEVEGFPEIDLYYFFEPRSPRLMRAWRNDSGLSMVGNGGHTLNGEEVRLAPESLALRHYMVRSQAHAFEKYAARVFAPDELERGWHKQRVDQPRDSFAFPPARFLKRMQNVGDRVLDKSDPWRHHFWQDRRRFA